MKANELSIGNWIIEPGQDNDKPFQIFSIYEEDKNSKLNGLPIALMQPVPLTEDWLIKFGFEKLMPNIEDEIKEELRTVIIFRKIPLTYNTSNGWWMNSNKIKIQPDYVHQLQNLYFALTGTELTLKN